jgi:hypothetical protein
VWQISAEDNVMMARRRLLLPALLVLLIAALALGLFVRGTHALAAPREPASTSEGPVASVVRLPDGSRDVCAAIRLAYPMDEVWEVITDYDHYGDVCELIHDARMERGPDGGTIAGLARTPLPRDVPFTIELKHEQELFEYRSTWDQASGDVLVNRGGWIARPVGPRETLLLIRQELQMRSVPTFLLRNLSRYRLCEVLRAVKRRLEQGPQGKPW